MAKITANNIFTGAITSDKLDASVASGLATANNANVVATIASTVAAAAFSTANTLSAILANTSTPIITSITIADSSYNALDDTAANTTGGYCIITGSGFVSTPTVVFGTTSAPAVSFVNSTTLRAQIPALTAASYPVYVVNSNGGTAIRINGLTTSSFPAWSTGATLSNQNSNTAFSVNLSASSDSNITYANTTALPAGTTLAANGLFSGTVSIGTQTTYTFDVKATDVENQDATRTFSITITVTPPNFFGWGRQSNFGELLDGTKIDRSSPVQVGGGAGNWRMVTTVGYFGMATKTDGTLWTWGYCHNGICGLNRGHTTYASSPIQIGSDTNWSSVRIIPASGGTGGACFATKSDGTLWSWGSNTRGHLGQNNTIFRSSPTQIGTGTNWRSVEVSVGGDGATDSHVMAIKTDGTLWGWGRNNSGQLALNNIVERSSPVQVGADVNWSNVNGSQNNFYGIKTNGTFWGWGATLSGASGVSRSSPMQIGTNSNWSLVRVANYTGETIATIKTDGTLWMFGTNNYQGQFGHNDARPGALVLQSPKQVGTNTNWNSINVSGRMTHATKTDGTLWAWGLNTYGQLGLNDIVARSSPVQVGTTTGWNLANTVSIASNLTMTTRP